MMPYFLQLTCIFEALGADRAFLDCVVLESLVLIYPLERRLLGELSEILRFQHFEIVKNIRKQSQKITYIYFNHNG